MGTGVGTGVCQLATGGVIAGTGVTAMGALFTMGAAFLVGYIGYKSMDRLVS